ncbi:hypothetical protein LTSEURB_3964, partial [Salmonella enterica subsp. enterica serovar Urbana str. R8-2977]
MNVKWLGRRERKNDDIYLVVVTADAGGIFRRPQTGGAF